MAELADAPDLGSGLERGVGSSPTRSTTIKGVEQGRYARSLRGEQLLGGRSLDGIHHEVLARRCIVSPESTHTRPRSTIGIVPLTFNQKMRVRVPTGSQVGGRSLLVVLRRAAAR